MANSELNFQLIIDKPKLPLTRAGLSVANRNFIPEENPVP